MLYEMARVLTS